MAHMIILYTHISRTV